MKRKIRNKTVAKIEICQIISVDGNKIKDVDTSKFKVGDKLYLDPDKPGAFITRSKQNMKADAWTAGLMFLGNFLMIYFRDRFPNNAPYDIMLCIFAMSAWFFLGKVIIYKIRK